MAAAAPASAPKGAKKTSAKKASVDHPSYDVMIIQAIKALDEKKGCSRQAIVKYIGSNNKVPEKFENRITLALKRMAKKGALSHTKGSGASGSFRLNEVKPKKAKKAPSKPKKVKKPASVKKAVKPKSPTKKKTSAKHKSKKSATPAKKTKKEKTAAPAQKPAPAKPKKSSPKKKSSKKAKKSSKK